MHGPPGPRPPGGLLRTCGSPRTQPRTMKSSSRGRSRSLNAANVSDPCAQTSSAAALRPPSVGCGGVDRNAQCAALHALNNQNTTVTRWRGSHGLAVSATAACPRYEPRSGRTAALSHTAARRPLSRMAVNRGTTQAEQGAPNGLLSTGKECREATSRAAARSAAVVVSDIGPSRTPAASRSTTAVVSARLRRRQRYQPTAISATPSGACASERRNSLAVSAVAGWRCVEASKTRPTHAAAAAAIPGAASASQDRPCGGAPRGVGISTAGASTPGS